MTFFGHKKVAQSIVSLLCSSCLSTFVGEFFFSISWDFIFFHLNSIVFVFFNVEWQKKKQREFFFWHSYACYHNSTVIQSQLCQQIFSIVFARFPDKGANSPLNSVKWRCIDSHMSDENIFIILFWIALEFNFAEMKNVHQIAWIHLLDLRLVSWWKAIKTNKLDSQSQFQVNHHSFRYYSFGIRSIAWLNRIYWHQLNFEFEINLLIINSKRPDGLDWIFIFWCIAYPELQFVHCYFLCKTRIIL